jgi:hypothetical protein
MFGRLGIGVVGAVLFIAVMCCGCASESETTTTVVEVATSVAQTTSSTANVTTTTMATTTTTMVTTTTEALTYQKWGGTVEVEGLRITVSEPVKDSNLYTTDAQGRRADATFKVLGAKVVLENITDAPHIYSATYFILADTEGNTYMGYDQDTSSYGKHVAMRSGYLDPGKEITRWVNYGIPNGAGAEGIWYSRDGTFGDSIQAIWQPSVPEDTTDAYNEGYQAEFTITSTEVSAQLVTSDDLVHFPGRGYVFLVIDATIRRLPRGSNQSLAIDETDVVLISAGGEFYQPIGRRVGGIGFTLGGLSSMMVLEADAGETAQIEVTLVYEVEETSIGGPLTLKFTEAPPVPFTVARQ